MVIKEILSSHTPPWNLSLPIFASRVSAGFPSPADEYLDGRLDLNDLVVRHPTSTFFVRVSGDSMNGLKTRIVNKNIVSKHYRSQAFNI